MAHVRPREDAIAEVRKNAAAKGYFTQGEDPIPVRIDAAPQGEGWLIAIATDGTQPLEGVGPSSPFRDIVGESATA